MRVFLDECDYLIHLIRCAIHNQQPRELPESLDFEMVYLCGVHHQVANIAFYSVAKLVNKPEQSLYHKWQSCRDKAVTRHVNQTYARNEIVSEFERAELRYLEVQGTKIKPLYPQPEWRTMSDIDFIIDFDNLLKGQDILQSLGYECKVINGVEVNGFRAPNIHVEIHTEYFPRNAEYHTTMRPPFSSVEETGEYDPNEFYIYNMLHIAKHYFSSGCGIRRILDAYYLNLNYGEVIDKDYVQSVLEKTNAGGFLNELGTLADRWFGREDRPGNRSDMERYILGSGLHGTRANTLNNRMRSAREKHGRFYRMKHIFSRTLGTPEGLRKRYPVLNRWKILYPFCWLHRLFCGLLPSRRKRFRKEMQALTRTGKDDHTR